MKQHKNGVEKSLSCKSKDNSHSTQLKTIFQYLQNHTATASMVTDATNVPQKCITRYKRDLEKAGRLKEIVKTTCKKTGFKAWYLTTNTELFPVDPQLSLFNAKEGVNHD